MRFKKPKNLAQALPWLLTVGGLLGFAAAFILTIEKIELIKDPNFVPSCNINPILSCGSVMSTDQASLFGFANSLIGVAGFAAITTIGVALLAGAGFKRWLWQGLQVGVIGGLAFVLWLQFQSIYVIEALCPYCMVVWTVMIPIFWYTTLYNLRQKNLPTPTSLRGVVEFAQRHHGDILTAWFLAIILIILNKFWYYWSTLL